MWRPLGKVGLASDPPGSWLGAVFETEEIFASGDRCVVRWLYRWAADEAGKPGHVRGVDIFRVRDGKVAEKLSYVKG